MARWARSLVVCQWPIATVLVGYVATALVVPTLANVAVTDDWVYYRSVEQLVTTHRLYVHQMSSAALVFQTVWGAAFAWFLGLSFGVLRVSTLVLVGVSGLAFYALCRELGVSPGWSAVGTAAYVFHPLTLSLAYTFMTDPHYTALLVISTWMYVRGLARSMRPAWVVAGSIVAAFALLVRQQGELVPLGVVAGLLVAGRLSPSWRSIGIIAQVAAIPSLTLVGYTLWLQAVEGTPWALGLFWADIAAAGWGGVAMLLPRLAGTEAVYLGLFVLPVALGAVPAVFALGRPLTPRSRVGVAAWAAVVLVTGVAFGLVGHFMPYAGQFITPTGLGPEDLVAARPPYLQLPVRVVLTVFSCLAAIVAGLAVARQAQCSSRLDRTGILLVLGIAVFQVIGSVVPSIHFIQWDGTLDRYLLPLLPLALVAVLWALRDIRLSALLVGVTLVAGSLFAIAGTRDHLAFLDTVWSVGREATVLGVPETHLDAGAGWDGFHLFEGPPTGSGPQHPGAPWWIDLFAPSVDAQYVVAGAPLPGYSVVLERGYASWLRFNFVPIYLLRRPGVAGPP